MTLYKCPHCDRRISKLVCCIFEKTRQTQCGVTCCRSCINVHLAATHYITYPWEVLSEKASKPYEVNV